MRQCYSLLACLLSFLFIACNGPRENIAISSDGVRIRYDVYGNGEPTLVFVHGWSNNRTFWDPHLAKFAQGHEVVALDLAGFGDSGTDRKAWTMESFAQDVVAVIKECKPEHIVLIGFSMGGAVVLEAARQESEKVDGVVLVDILQNVEDTYTHNEIEAFISHWHQTWHNPQVLRDEAFSPNTEESLIQRYIDNTPALPPDYWWEAAKQFFTWCNTRSKETIQHVECSIISINSDRVPTDVESFRRYSPSFMVKTIPSVGHLGVIWEKVDVFDKLLEESIQKFAERR